MLSEFHENSPLLLRKQRLTTMRCIREVYQEKGIKGFYRGLSASYLGSLDTAANFAIYEFLKRHLLAWHRGTGSESGADQEFNPLRSQLRSQSEAALTIVASFVSKLSAVVISYPHGEAGACTCSQKCLLLKNIFGSVLQKYFVHACVSPATNTKAF